MLPYHARYFHFLFQLLQYDPNAKEKLHNMAAADYAYWRAAIQQAKDSGELRKDLEEAIVMFRQVYLGSTAADILHPLRWRVSESSDSKTIYSLPDMSKRSD